MVKNPLKALVIDDNPADARLLERYLKDSTMWEVETASCESGADALAALKDFHPEVVFVDYILGAESGMEAIRVLKAAGLKAAYVMLTGMGGEEVAVSALREGVDDYLTKAGLTPEVLDMSLRHVTEKRRANEIIRETNKLLQNVFTTTQTLLAYLDKDFNFIAVNRAYAEADGHEPEFYKDKNHFSLFPNEENETIFRHVVDTGEPFLIYSKPFSYPLNPERGVTYWDWELKPVKDASGAVNALVLSLMNVTERVKAEEERMRLATAIEQSAEAIIVTGADGAIQYVNPAFERVTGYTKAEAVGQTPRILKSGKHGGEFYRELWEHIKAGNVWRGVFVNKKKDGTLFEEETTISPIRGPGGDIINFVAVKRDVSREAALRKAREYFTSVASHELRTPLTMMGLVMAFINNLKEEPPDPHKVDQIKSVLDESVSRLDRIVSATSILSDVSILDATSPREDVFIFYELVSSIQSALVMIEISHRSLKLDVNINQLSRDAKVKGAPEMIRRVIDEIISNAVKYTPDGRKITVHAAEEGGFVVVTVADEGIGLPKDKIEQIFEPYFSLEDSRHHSTGRYKYMGGGIGLGLTIAKLLTEQYGGVLSIVSPGENLGATVTVRLPQAK
ncbi:MAG: PAS domain S-box protein [Nitrospinae bacterium]|nr:PAS domain S-box protein [Nitrospinota bacterium]